IRLMNLRTRMPFKYGIATMVSVPQLFVRLQVEVAGRTTVGISADLLPPKWFTKDPAKSVEKEVEEMLSVIQHALKFSEGLEGADAFEIWQQLYEKQLRWGGVNHLPPLLTNFGCSMVERALIEAVCRALNQPFARALKSGQLGLRLDAIHPSLRGLTTADFLPAQPLDRLIIRHTVGLADPLADSDIAEAERLNDGLPQSLAGCITTYGLRHFKIKVNGDLERDIDRLERIAALIEQNAPADYAFSLDGNEQFKSIAALRTFWESVQKSPQLHSFLQRLLFVEQPLHRDVALQPGIALEFQQWRDRPPIIIDESDATLESLPVALQLGYAGTSHKNCKGIFKGIANCSLLAHEQKAQPERRFVMSGEDLCNIGPVALLQDLTVMATLGIRSVERNGHHYNAGLSQFPKPIQEQVLTHHSDLYHRSAAGWPTLTIESGTIDITSLHSQPFGVGFVPNVEQFLSLEDWRSQPPR
ncbi:MAG: hypothetical protein ABI651_20320, partial [Verrucomicrobiota bacterium]